mmetsp:Transcript_5610/g.5245  ORF Transcript_5610/g.5245 Transcript_5610/m.5245 type:complete len:122 (-) Transcript_5610:148-513(-)
MGHDFQKFEQVWLSRYPRPNPFIHDNGREFIGELFKRKLEHRGITDVPTTSRNPTSNSVCESMHQTMGNLLRTRLNQTVNDGVLQTNLVLNPLDDILGAKDLIDEYLATSMYATRVQTNLS